MSSWSFFLIKCSKRFEEACDFVVNSVPSFIVEVVVNVFGGCWLGGSGAGCGCCQKSGLGRAVAILSASLVNGLILEGSGFMVANRFEPFRKN